MTRKICKFADITKMSIKPDNTTIKELQEDNTDGQ